jgi:hypothetical protein
MRMFDYSKSHNEHLETMRRERALLIEQIRQSQEAISEFRICSDVWMSSCRRRSRSPSDRRGMRQSLRRNCFINPQMLLNRSHAREKVINLFSEPGITRAQLL